MTTHHTSLYDDEANPAPAMVLSLLSRTIPSSETRRKYSDMPVSCSWVVEMVVMEFVQPTN